MSQLVKTKCLKCSAEIVKGDKLEIIEGKKQYRSFELDGKTVHVCKTKETGKKYVPPKPRERFSYDELVDQDGLTRKLYSVQREGFVNELDPEKTFSEMQQMIWKFRAVEMGNPKHLSEEPKR